NFEGWSAQADQALAEFIMLDLSEVTGEVAVDGVELGAIWAPKADLVFGSDTTTNGQWFAQDVTTSGGGEIHHYAFGGELVCDEDPAEDPTEDPTEEPTEDPTDDPTDDSSDEPSDEPTEDPTDDPTTVIPGTDEPGTDD